MATFPIGPAPVKPSSEDLTLFRKQGISQSIFSGASTIINQYAQWQLQLGFPPVNRGSVAERKHKAWLLSLRGSEGSFLYYPVDSGKNITGKTLLSPGFAESSAIVVTGWTGGQATGLDVGDYFSIGNKLFMITQVPVNATGGNVTIEFEPPLRANALQGSTVNFLTPRIEVRLVGGKEGQGTNKDPDFNYLKPLQAVEAL